MVILYNCLFVCIALMYLPVYMFRRKLHRGLLRRLGLLPRGVHFDSPVWVHAVSVGETVTARALIEELRARFPGRQFVISTVTATGNAVARPYAQDGDFVTYLPFDLSCVVRRVIRRVRPALFVIVETEIWPNLITVLHDEQVPVVTVNGRLSDRSFRGYRLLRPLLRSLLEKITFFCMQSDGDAERLLRLGADPGKVRVTGNMKFDAVKAADEGDAYPALRRRLGLEPGSVLMAAGSTHPGEDEIIIQTYAKLRGKHCDFKLLLAPRHPERAGRVAELVKRRHFDAVLLSTLTLPVLHEFSRRTVFILDTVGELAGYYAAADIVFVGGSLMKKGGHNILEPAAFGKPVIFGPHMFNFRDIAAMFLERDAALRVRNRDELEAAVMRCLEDRKFAQSLGERAQKLVAENNGATRRTVELLACHTIRK